MDNLLNSLEANGNDEAIQETLGEIKKHLLSYAQESKCVLTSKKFQDISNSDLAYDILELCMSNLNISEEPDLSDIVKKLLEHPNAKVKTIAVRFVEKNLHQISALHNFSMVIMFVECLQSDEASVGVPSIKILVDLLSMQNFVAEAKPQLLAALDKNNETIALRIYSVAVGLACKSPAMLDRVEFILQRCLLDIEKQDPLLLMNILEVLKDICLESYGLVYLENKGVFSKLMKRIETISQDPLSSLLVPGLMKFFGNVAVVHPEKIFNAYPTLINILFDSLFSDDFQLLYTALDTLGHLAKFENGKRALDSLNSDQCLKVMSQISTAIPSYPSELKVRALNCLENVFWIDPSASRNNQINFICQKWFQCVFGSNLSMLLNFCHNPFDDIATSAFKCLQSISYHDFGQKAIGKTGGFIEFLLDRNTKASHEVKTVKFEVIKTLSESNAFNATITLQLQRYVREGFNYVQAITEVAFESA